MQQYIRTIFGMKKINEKYYNAKIIYVTEYAAKTEIIKQTNKLEHELHEQKQGNRDLKQILLNLAEAMQSLSEEDKQVLVLTMHSLDVENHSYFIERDTKD